MSKYDLRIQTVVDGILNKANKANTELIIEHAFDDPDKKETSVIVHNIELNLFGIIGVDIVEYPDDAICFFIFNGKMFDYCRAEGFDKKSMLKCFPDTVLKKVNLKNFVNFVLDGSKDK